LPQLKTHGFGNFTVLLGNVRIGNTGVYIRDGMEHPDIGFAFLPQYFGKGYAFEAATSVLEFMKLNTNIKVLQAITLPRDKASVKLLKSLGFHSIKLFYFEGDDEELMLLEQKIK
jgi:RimJ/RimL family protein N-acetyltransferase